MVLGHEVSPCGPDWLERDDIDEKRHCIKSNADLDKLEWALLKRNVSLLALRRCLSES